MRLQDVIRTRHELGGDLGSRTITWTETTSLSSRTITDPDSGDAVKYEVVPGGQEVVTITATLCGARGLTPNCHQ